ncbi:beta-galactosidase [Natronospora cellulosivora (SeqCode)]
MKKYKAINNFNNFIHGADYYPEQWLDRPDILEEDIRLMKKSNTNTIRVGVFAWTALEPEEGKYNFEWLDKVFERLHENGIKIILATPSGARPDWIADKYPEVLRVNDDRKRILFSRRHNHCYTSPVYREKTAELNRKLAERYGKHPALLMWHISNEYGGSCHCDLCQEAFREWLKDRYGTLENLNKAWWTTFWNHTFTDWSRIESPAPHGLKSNHALNLDWKRFVTEQTIDFYRNEIKPIRELTPSIPITTNFMYKYVGLNYWKFASEVDVVCWDSYPAWHGNEEDWDRAIDVAFIHDTYRSLKGGQPFMLMESTPSMTNWQPIAKLKRPAMHKLSSIQAVAHGADSVQYFQWRKSRGGFEKFHGAVVDHSGRDDTRVFKDVAELGDLLKKFDPVIGTSVDAEVAIISDWENRWAIDDAAGPHQEKKDYLETCRRHYKEFWQQGVAVDVIDMEQDFSKYKLLIAPMLYMVKEGVAERIEEFVKNGGTFVSTYWSGIVNDTDLCFLGGYPGPLKDVLGIWVEEIDALYDEDSNRVLMKEDNSLALEGEYKAAVLCDLLHLETATALASYQDDFYAGRPALTVNNFGQGKAYYIASRNEDKFLSDFYQQIINKLELSKAINTNLPHGVTAQLRRDGEKEYIFIMNFNDEEKEVQLDKVYTSLITGQKISGDYKLRAYAVDVLCI